MSAKEEVVGEPIAIAATKAAYRKHVWQELERNRLANFPRPVFGRIPNFKGSEEAAERLTQLEEFRAAVNVEVNPDKAQENARVVVLENEKRLYVPVPRLKDGLLKLIRPSSGGENNTHSKADVRAAVTRRGIEHHGENVVIKDDLKIDLFIMGSVAVSVDGHRIGKGKGYADLEYAVLSELNAITDSTIIVTIVHDMQVFDMLPAEMFQPFDVPVDYILTPTKIVKVQKRLPRPAGIIWSILSNRRVTMMPILQELKAATEQKGGEVTLKAEDTDVETYEPRRFPPFKRQHRRRPRSEGRTSDSQAEDSKDEAPKRAPRTRFYRRRRFMGKEKDVENDVATEVEKGERAMRFRRPFRRNKSQIDFSLMVSNIEKNVRVRDLKNALNERGVKPNEITWRGYKGFCYLHYAKPKPAKSDEENDTPASAPPPVGVDNVIEILQNLKFDPESDNSLSVKVMDPISRIETTDVTAV